jgi:hypothetical protein
MDHSDRESAVVATAGGGRPIHATGPSVLAKELDETPPSGLSVLTADEREDLAVAIADAKRRQARALADAGDQALNLIPRILRGPVRKLFG